MKHFDEVLLCVSKLDLIKGSEIFLDLSAGKSSQVSMTLCFHKSQKPTV